MLLFTGGKNILIDTAVKEAYSPFLLRELSELSLKTDDIDIILNTHQHADHIGMNEAVCNDSGCEIKTGLTDGEIIDAGDYKIKAVHTPGHTADSVSFLELNSGILFCGDAIEGRGSRYAGVALYENPSELLESVEKIRRLYIQNQIGTIYLGHAYYGTCGVLKKDEILNFLNLCSDTVKAYGDFLSAMPPGTTVREARIELLKKFAVSETLIDEKSAEITVKAYFNNRSYLS